MATVYVGSSCRGFLIKGLIQQFGLNIRVATEKDQAYHDAFPLGKVPALIGQDGFHLTEVIAILYYIIELGDKNSPLLGETANDRAKVLSWLSMTNSELLPQAAAAFFPLVGRAPYNKERVTDALGKLERIAGVYETALSQKSYLVGGKVTLADLFGVTMVLRPFQHLWGADWRSAHPNLVKWFNNIKTHELISEFFKDFEFIEKPRDYE